MTYMKRSIYIYRYSGTRAVLYVALHTIIVSLFIVTPAIADPADELREYFLNKDTETKTTTTYNRQQEASQLNYIQEIINLNNKQRKTASKWSPYLHLTSKVGDDRKIGRFVLMCPLWQSSDSMFYSDIRSTFDNDDNVEGNVGLGFRRIIKGNNNDDFIWGVYGFYDKLKTSADNQFNQGMFGAELLKNNFELRGNIYLPENRSYIVGSRTVSSVSLSGTTVMERNQSLVARERALPGFDAEVGYGFNIGQKDKLWIHGGYFNFNHSDAPEIAGPRMRLHCELNDVFGIQESTLAIGVEVQHDKIRKNETFACISLSIPFGAPRDPWRESGKKSDIESRMMRPVIRDIDVITNTDDINKSPGSVGGPEIVSDTEGPLIDDATGEQVDMYFVDADGSAAGTGTQESPMTIVQAENTSGISDFIFLLNDSGSIDVNTISGGTFTLKPNQQLLGVGDNTSRDVLLPNNLTLNVSSTAGRPSLSRLDGADVVRMLWNNTIDGINISGGDDGIYGLNVDNPTIRDVTIQNTASNAINLANSSGTITISDSVIQNNTTNAIYLSNTAGGSATACISGNNISNNTGVGLYCVNSDASILTGTFQNNTISDNGTQGIYINNTNSGVATIDISDNEISNNLGIGLYGVNTNTSTLTGTFQNNIVSGNGAQGIYCYTSNGSTGNIDIFDNQITGNTNEGLRMYSYTGSTVTATVRDNLISDSQDDNIYCYNSESTLNLTLNNNDIINSAVDTGVRISNVLDGGIISANITGNRITGNINRGLLLYNSGTTFSTTIQNNTITGNQAGGIDYDTDAGATTLTIENNNISNNSGGSSTTDDFGVSIDQDTDPNSTLELTLSNNTIEGNGYRGVNLNNADGTYNASLIGNSIVNNSSDGVYIVNQTTGILTVDLYSNTITNNAVRGVWLSNDTGTLNAMFESNTIKTNTNDGLELDNVNGGTFDCDLGGGTFGSAGLNSIYSNTSGYDIDNDTGISIKAENNWWGITAPNPARLVGPVDYDPWLTSEPD
jgi:hypothetical protein